MLIALIALLMSSADPAPLFRAEPLSEERFTFAPHSLWNVAN